MATFTADMFGVEVVVPGAARMDETSFHGDGSTTFVPGDLVCINTSGYVTDANIGATAAGDIHGMILTNAYSTTAATTSQIVPVYLFAADTVLAMQLYHATAASAVASALTIGKGYRLRNNAAGIWGIDVANADGSMIYCGIPGNTKWFDGDFSASKELGIGYFRINTSVLEGYAA